MNQTISLNGIWELGYCEIGRGIHPPYTLKCPVPGDVRMAFMDAGMIKEPLSDTNTDDCRWLESKEFWYRRRFSLDCVPASSRSLLTFDGLDCTADVWLNDRYLGRSENSFVETEYDVSSILLPGENTLVVRIDSGVNEAKKHPLDDMDKMWNSDQPYRVWMRKPQFVYGWDWTPWLETCGIWRSVTLAVYDRASVTELYLHQPDNSVPTEGQAVLVQAEISLDRVLSDDYELILSVRGDTRFDSGDEVACAKIRIPADPVSGGAAASFGANSRRSFCLSASADPSTVECTVSFTIPDARLWWSNGLGDPYLYRVELTLCGTDGGVIQTVTQDYGIKSISLREEALSDTESGFTFLLNGTPVFCKGADHVPADCLIGRITDAKNEALIALAAASHMNMLRVWGGGFYESEAFMRACNRAGIMVWHDFMFACGYYPDHDTQFTANVRNEAVRAVRRLRRHTSLIGWSGNNEIHEMYRGMMTYDPLARPYGMKLFGKVLPEIVGEYCPNLIYRESSPFGGEDPAGSLCGDQHIWHFTHRPNFEHYLDLVHFTDFPVKFLSEFGIIGAMSLESTKRSMPSSFAPASSDGGASAAPSLPSASADDSDPAAPSLPSASADDGDLAAPSLPSASADGSDPATPPLSSASADEIDRESRAWLHHCNTSSDHRILDLVMKAYFDRTDEMGLQEYILKSQALQAEITKYLYEEFRRRKFVCSGLLFWTLSDSWGIHNWSLIDYYLDKKPVYYALKRAMSPIEISIQGYCPQSFEGMREYREYYAGSPAPLQIWLSNDTRLDEELTIRYAIYDFDGGILLSGEKNTSLPANVSMAAETVPICGKITKPERTVMHAEVYRSDTLLSEADYLFAPYRALALTQAVIRWHVGEGSSVSGSHPSYRADDPACPKETADAPILLSLTADRFVWQLHIGGTDRIDVSDNDFHMLPGRKYTVEIRRRPADLPGTCAAADKPLCADAFVPTLLSAGIRPRAVRE